MPTLRLPDEILILENLARPCPSWALSALLYGLNYLIFRDGNYMFRLFLAQLGFLPISVLLVTIIINQLLSQRAKAAKLRKLNMVIGAFFSEVGGAIC